MLLHQSRFSYFFIFVNLFLIFSFYSFFVLDYVHMIHIFSLKVKYFFMFMKYFFIKIFPALQLRLKLDPERKFPLEKKELTDFVDNVTG